MAGNDFEVQLIKEQLREADIGDVITFSELSALTGRDIQFKHSYVLRRALDELIEEDNLVFENVRNIGYRKMSDSDLVLTTKRIDRIQRQSKRGIKEKVCVDYDALTPQEKVLQQGHLTILAIVKSATGKREVKWIERRMKSTEQMLSEIQKSIDLLVQKEDTRRDET